MRLYSRCLILHVVVLAFVGCSFARNVWLAPLVARQAPAELVEPSLDRFLNQTVLNKLKTIPHERTEWVDEVTNTTFPANLRLIDDLGLKARSRS